MEFKSVSNSKSSGDTAVLLVNLGTPTALTLASVFQFLRLFLWDRRVVNLPRWLWWMLLHMIVLPLRSFRAFKLYQKIWKPEGSPLQVWTESLTVALSKKLKEELGLSWTVDYAMTYGTPNIPDTLKMMETNRLSRLIILPLFPQYSGTTTGAIFDKISDYFKQCSYIPSLHFIHEYASSAHFQEALTETILAHWHSKGRTERLLFSFHGIPVSYEALGDPYPKQCEALAKTIASRLNLSDEEWALGYQSRVGWKAWVEPSLLDIIKRWRAQGIQSISVLSPSFSVDCLETLEELNIQYREKFIRLGGENFQYIPALNDSVQHVEALTRLLHPYF